MYLFASVLGLVDDSKSSKMRPSSFSFFQFSASLVSATSPVTRPLSYRMAPARGAASCC
ncbi:Uncharacterised protein [Bordetella pertussis]|nr:Uncharacterised protein [Bordetella pertussis]